MKGLHACVAHGLRTLTVRRTAARGLSVAVPAVQEIHAQLRTEAGSRRSGELRDNGRLPSLLYGVGHDGARDNVMVTVSTRDIAAELRRRRWAFENTLYDLVLEDGSRCRVVPHQLQRHPVTMGIYGLNFLRFSRNTTRKLFVRFVNEEASPALRRGGFIVRVNKTIMCGFDIAGDGGEPQVAGSIIPPFIDIDVSNVKVGDTLRLRDVQLPDWVYPYRAPPDTVLAVVQGSRRDIIKGRGA